MEMGIPDEVRRELVIHASQDQVWRALTEAEQMTRPQVDLGRLVRETPIYLEAA